MEVMVVVVMAKTITASKEIGTNHKVIGVLITVIPVLVKVMVVVAGAVAQSETTILTEAMVHTEVNIHFSFNT